MIAGNGRIVAFSRNVLHNWHRTTHVNVASVASYSSDLRCRHLSHVSLTSCESVKAISTTDVLLFTSQTQCELSERWNFQIHRLYCTAKQPLNEDCDDRHSKALRKKLLQAIEDDKEASPSYKQILAACIYMPSEEKFANIKPNIVEKTGEKHALLKHLSPGHDGTQLQLVEHVQERTTETCKQPTKVELIQECEKPKKIEHQKMQEANEKQLQRVEASQQKPDIVKCDSQQTLRKIEILIAQNAKTEKINPIIERVHIPPNLRDQSTKCQSPLSWLRSLVNKPKVTSTESAVQLVQRLRLPNKQLNEKMTQITQETQPCGKLIKEIKVIHVKLWQVFSSAWSWADSWLATKRRIILSKVCGSDNKQPVLQVRKVRQKIKKLPKCNTFTKYVQKTAIPFMSQTRAKMISLFKRWGEDVQQAMTLLKQQWTCLRKMSRDYSKSPIYTTCITLNLGFLCFVNFMIGLVIGLATGNYTKKSVSNNDDRKK